MDALQSQIANDGCCHADQQIGQLYELMQAIRKKGDNEDGQ